MNNPKRELVLVAALLLTGCLGGLGGEPQQIRYFSPAYAPRTGVDPVDSPVELRLRRVRSSGHLRERIVWRSSDVEYGFYDLSRWTAPPEAIVEVDLVSELFERHGLVRSSSLSAPSLDVNIVVFEEHVEPHEARVTLQVNLEDREGRAILSRSFSSHEAVAGDDLAEVAAAMSRALQDVIERVAAEIRAVLVTQ